MAETKTISSIAKGESSKELVLENVVLGSHKKLLREFEIITTHSDRESRDYFAFNPDRPELTVEVKGYPGFSVDYNNLLIQHYQNNNIPVVVKGGSYNGILLIKKAYKNLDEKEMVLVSSIEHSSDMN